MFRGNGLSTMTSAPPQASGRSTSQAHKKRGARKPKDNSELAGYKKTQSARLGEDGRRSKPKKPYVHENSGSSNDQKSRNAPSGVSNFKKTPSTRPNAPVKTTRQTFLAQEKEITGPLIPDPMKLGFKHKQTYTIRSIPKYMIQQSRLLETPEFTQDPWDRDNQAKMLSRELQVGGRDYQGLYEEFQKMREVERRQMEELGLVDAENTAKDLNDAISFRGTCLDMCPVFERVRRALENNVKALEKDPTTKKISRERAVKAFSRPAAGQPPPLPSDVRPPHILFNTLNYLVDNVLNKLPESHSFIWDRTRSIRQDFTYQNSFGPEAIDCNERIVRIHLCCLHTMAGSEVEYLQQQELEQFNKALQTLLEIYKDVRNHGGEAPNEAEFRAYYLLSHIRDPEPERELQQLPKHILQDNYVQLALMFRNIVSQSNIVERGYENTVGSLSMFSEFFKLIYSKEIPVLMAFLLETHFNEIRFYALKSISLGYHSGGKPMTAHGLQELLGFESVEKLNKFVKYYEIDTPTDNDGNILVDLANKEKKEHYKLKSLHDKPKLGPPFSPQLNQNFNQDQLNLLVNSGKPNGKLKFGALNVVNPTKKSFQPSVQPNTISGGDTGVVFHRPANTSNFVTSGNNNISNDSGSKNALSFGTSAPISAQSWNNSSKQGDIAAPAAPVAPFSFTIGAQQETSLQKKTPSVSLMTPLSGSKTPDFNFGKSLAESTLKKETSNLSPAQEVLLLTSVPAPSELPKNLGLGASTFSMPVAQATTSQAVLKFGAPPEKEAVVSKILEIKDHTKEAIPVNSKKLVDSPYFNDAAKQLALEIFQNFFDQELKKSLPQLTNNYNKTLAKKRMLNETCFLIYQNMVSDYALQKSLEVYANERYKTNLKRQCIKMIIRTGLKSIEKSKIKKRKQMELSLVEFNNTVLRKKHKLNQKSSKINEKEKMIIKNDPIAYINDSKRAVEQLWEPLDVLSFTKELSCKIKVSIESKDIELLFLLAIEDWSSDYSKWLKNKLQLKPFPNEMLYRNVCKTDHLVLNFTSLPPSYENKVFYTKVPFVLLEIGSTKPMDDIRSKLQTDCLKLKKIVQLLSNFSYYKVQIGLLFWNVSNETVNLEEVLSTLELSNIENSEIISQIHICDMTLELKEKTTKYFIPGSSINARLNNLFATLVDNYRGDYSARGKKKLEKYKQQLKRNRVSSQRPVLEAAQIVKTKENDLLKRAKELRRYNYLSRHVASANLTHQNNTIGVNDTTRDSTLPSLNYSTSFFLNRSMARPHFNNTTVNESTINPNISILGGLGQGIVQESTPFSSPEKPSALKDAKGSASLQELRNLTLVVKNKYRNLK